VKLKLTTEQQKLVTDNYNLIHHVLKRLPYARKDYEEYTQVAALGLCSAALRFDPSRGAFSTYAVRTIQWVVYRYRLIYDRSLIKNPCTFESVVQCDTLEDKYLILYTDAIATQNTDEDDLITSIVLKDMKKRYTGVNAQVFSMVLAGCKQIDIADKIQRSQAQVSRIQSRIKNDFKEAIGV